MILEWFPHLRVHLIQFSRLLPIFEIGSNDKRIEVTKSNCVNCILIIQLRLIFHTKENICLYSIFPSSRFAGKKKKKKSFDKWIIKRRVNVEWNKTHFTHVRSLVFRAKYALENIWINSFYNKIFKRRKGCVWRSPVNELLFVSFRIRDMRWMFRV